jgi:MSHA pilin protein MshC
MDRKGFTLIELMMVLVLLGILAIFAAPRLLNVTATNAGAFADKLRADIRYAQDLAMTQNRRYRVYFNTAPSPNPGYAVVNDANGNGVWGEAGEIALNPAGGGNLSVTLNANQFAGLTVSTPAGGYIEFNSLGVPTVGGGVSLTIFGNLVSAGTITITANSGAVN